MLFGVPARRHAIAYNLFMPIHILPLQIVEKIAAGEVIERPASVVRELLENSLDAGAKHISVSIKEGGLSEISVSDDGSGIPREELPLAFARHATSKIIAFEDLQCVKTLGFRGEALASIAAVADVLLTTCCGNGQDGAKAHFAFGEEKGISLEACRKGTTALVRDLFANVPARRKFLRKPATEAEYVTTLVSRYAIAHADVAFNTQVDGRKVLETLGGTLPDAIRRVYGPEIGDSLLPFTANGDGISLQGYASPPELHRSAARYIDIFVNGRWIQDRILNRAVLEAYRSLLPSGRFPIAVMLLDVQPDKVDMNVHPAKAEVRFADPDRLFPLVLKALRQTTSQPNLVPGLSLPGQTNPPTISGDWQVHNALLGLQPRSGAVTIPDLPGSEAQQVQQTHPIADKNSLPPLRVVGQIRQMYIVAEGPDGLYLVDQHAAHERVLYERFMAERREGQAISQGLLAAQPVTLGANRSQALPRIAERLEALGFAVEPFAFDSVMLRAIPAILAQRGDNPEQALLEVIDCLLAGDDERWLEHSLVRLVCHSAVRAGETLSIAEMREIMQALEQTNSPRTCPHGRPTMLYLSADQVAREFGRR